MAASMVPYYSCLFSQWTGRNVFSRCVTPTLEHCSTAYTRVRYGTRRSGSLEEQKSAQSPVYLDTLWTVTLIDQLTVSYSRSSGPGGQHVNKVSTKAEVRFHVQTADWIPQDVREKILIKNRNRINKAGELLVTSELSRSQQRNLTDCIQKISALIAEATEKPFVPTAEDVAVRTARLEKRNKERLKEKKIHSAIKQSRKVDFD